MPLQPDPAALARIGRRGAVRDAYLNMLPHADDRGVVILRGGVRGWSEIFGCSPSYPRQALATLVAEEIVAVDYLGDGLAEVTIVRGGSITDQTDATPVAPLASAAPHQNAAGDRSLIVPPQTPHEEIHDLTCGGGGGGGAATPALLPNTDDPVAQALVELGVGIETARDLAPAATLEQIAYLARGARRRGADVPAWVVAGIKAGRRPAPPPGPEPARPSPAPQPTPRAEFLRRRAAAAGAVASSPAADPPGDGDAAGDAEIGQAPLSDAARAEWRRRYWTAAADERPAVLAALRAAVAEAAQPAAAPPDPEPAPGPSLAQTWQATQLELQRELSRAEYDAWLRHAMLVSLDGSLARVAAPTPLHVERLSRSSGLIRRALGAVLGYPVQLQLVAGGEVRR